MKLSCIWKPPLYMSVLANSLAAFVGTFQISNLKELSFVEASWLSALQQSPELTMLNIFHVKMQRWHQDSYSLRALVVEELHHLINNPTCVQFFIMKWYISYKRWKWRKDQHSKDSLWTPLFDPLRFYSVLQWWQNNKDRSFCFASQI